MLHDFNFDFFNVLNQIKQDKYGRVSAFLAINKPKGITSHDLVDQVRKRLGTKKVGHVGALDPAASGVMFILVGKKYTKLSDKFMHLDKAYRTKIILGVQTDTLDIEGDIVKISDVSSFQLEEFIKVLNKFEGGYNQQVPIFSSVKVNGDKLRVLARQSERFEIQQGDERKKVVFYNIKGKGKNITLDIPHRIVLIKNIKILSEGRINKEVYDFIMKYREKKEINDKLPVIEIEFDCSKGTYVRQFAADIAEEINQVGMICDLIRIKIGPVKLEDCIDIKDVQL